MERNKALSLLKENLKNQNLIKHSLAVEASMRALASHFNEDVDEAKASSPPAFLIDKNLVIEKWGICGLLHDIDYEKVKGDEKLHSKKGCELLKSLGFDEEICDAILSHNEIHGIEPKTKMAKALFCVDPLTGLIVANTLVFPSRKINDLSVENVLKRFKEKAFARGVNREIIGKCQEYLELSLEEFVGIVLSSMQKISEELGL